MVVRLASTGAALALLVGTLVAPASGLPAAPSAAAPQCKGRPVTILGTEDADTIRGSNQRDVILALGGDDRVDGRGGNDVICGGAGRDFINGDAGHDKLFGGADGRSTVRNDDGIRLMVGDVVQGGPGDDLIDLGYDERQQTFGSAERDRLSYKGSAFRVIVTLGTPKGRGHARGDGRDIIKSHPFLALLGSDRDDVLTGSTYGDQILGRGGADTIDGGGGRDVLVDGLRAARAGDDVLIGGIGRDSLTSYGGHDQLDGGSSADLLTVLHAQRGSLSLKGGPGADVLSPSDMLPGSCVRVVGGGGSDELLPVVSTKVAEGKVVVNLKHHAFGVRQPVGTCGFVDTVESLTVAGSLPTQQLRWLVTGTGVAETVLMRDGSSVLAAMAGGDDRVSGSTGNDNLKGGPGDDRLFGGGGNDVANGGPGTDTCRKVDFRKHCEIPKG
jgi:Ca2+-binding RTX toxin-like protein